MRERCLKVGDLFPAAVESDEGGKGAFREKLGGF